MHEPESMHGLKTLTCLHVGAHRAPKSAERPESSQKQDCWRKVAGRLEGSCKRRGRLAFRLIDQVVAVVLDHVDAQALQRKQVT